MKPIILLFLFSLSLLTAEDKEVLNTVVPDEKIRMINGEFSELKNYVGDGPLLLEFWTTWCPNCPKQMGYLSDLADHFKNSGLQVLGVNLNAPKIVNKVVNKISGRRSKRKLVPVNLTLHSQHGYGVEEN